MSVAAISRAIRRAAAGGGVASDAFVTTWLTTAPNETITLPLRSGYSYDMTVDWGDGSPPSVVTSYDDADRVHAYATPGTQTVTITGTCTAWYFNNGGDKLKFRTVQQWGNTGFTGLGLVAAFRGCANATYWADLPYMPVTSLNQTWYDCRAATAFPDVSALTDVSRLVGTWYSCMAGTSFPDISALTKVTTLDSAWVLCTSAQQFPPVNALVDVTTLSYAWYSCSNATSFPTVSALTKVASLAYTWFACSKATAFPDVSALTKVTNYSAAWRNCSGATIVPLFPASSTAVTNTSQALRGIGAGMGGTVVDLWNAAKFPNITSYANTFEGCTGLANYADIPAGWKGL